MHRLADRFCTPPPRTIARVHWATPVHGRISGQPCQHAFPTRTPCAIARRPPPASNLQSRSAGHIAMPNARSASAPVNMATVSDGHNKNGAEVVNDRQRQHEHAQALRNARTQKRQSADDKGGVGCHDRAPTALAGMAGLQHEVQRCGHQHAAQGTRNGQRGHARIVQLAQHKFPFELKGTRKKNSVIKPSLIQSRKERANSSWPICKPTGVSQALRNG